MDACRCAALQVVDAIVVDEDAFVVEGAALEEEVELAELEPDDPHPVASAAVSRIEQRTAAVLVMRRC